MAYAVNRSSACGRLISPLKCESLTGHSIPRVRLPSPFLGWRFSLAAIRLHIVLGELDYALPLSGDRLYTHSIALDFGKWWANEYVNGKLVNSKHCGGRCTVAGPLQRTVGSRRRRSTRHGSG